MLAPPAASNARGASANQPDLTAAVDDQRLAIDDLGYPAVLAALERACAGLALLLRLRKGAPAHGSEQQQAAEPCRETVPSTCHAVPIPFLRCDAISYTIHYHLAAKRQVVRVTGVKAGQRRAIVIGGSISGLFAALLLQRHGWRVDVYERSAGELAGRGAGIVAQPELREALAAAGIGDIGDVGVRIDTRILLDRDGVERYRCRCPQTVTSWERVHRLLRARFPDAHYHNGFELKHIDQSGRLPRAHFADGSVVEADLVIGADGIRSSVRQQLFPDAALEYTGYVGWRSLIEERMFSPDTHARTFWTMSFGLPEGEQFIGYPVTGANDSMTPGSLRWNVIWYRPADERELARLLTDVNGKVHEVSIPPPLIRPEVRAEQGEAAARLLAPEFREAVGLSPQSFLQPIYDLESRRLAAGRVAVIGDAAFVARPHVAAGVIKAAEDVLSMVAALDEEASVEAALERFEAERLVVGRRIIARARQMGASYRALPPGSPRAPGDHDAAYVRAVVEDTALTTFLGQPDDGSVWRPV